MARMIPPAPPPPDDDAGPPPVNIDDLLADAPDIGEPSIDDLLGEAPVMTPEGLGFPPEESPPDEMPTPPPSDDGQPLTVLVDHELECYDDRGNVIEHKIRTTTVDARTTWTREEILDEGARIMQAMIDADGARYPCVLLTSWIRGPLYYEYARGV